MRRRHPHACVDCGIRCDGDQWCMLRDPVWAETGLAPDGGVLCLLDIERRLGRQLRFSDFRRCNTDFQYQSWGHTRMVPPGWQAHVRRRRYRRGRKQTW